MHTTLIKNAAAIVTVDSDNRVLRGGNILIHDNRIQAVGETPESADTVIDATGCYVYPGLVNTHHHLYQTFTRNLPQVQKMELFDWLKTLYEIWRGLSSQTIYHSSLVGMGELLKYGCTTCMDHHYVFPRTGSDEFIDMQFAAAKDLGIRFFATRGSMSLGKSKGGLPPDDLVQDSDSILADCERLVSKYHDASEFSMRQIGLAPCSPFSVTTDLLKQSAALARKLKVRLHTHLAETNDEEQFCLEKFGMRPLDYMASCGWLGDDVWYAHGIHFNDNELKLLAETGTGIAHCPSSNMKLSSGVCQVPRIMQLGVKLGLAVDGSASNDNSNLLAEIRSAYLMHRLNCSETSPTGYDILKLATKGSAELLGRSDIGSLEVGKAADLFMLDANLLELVGTELDPMNLLATVGYARPAKYVMVDGKLVCENGQLLGIDESKVIEESRALVKELLK